VSWGNCAKGTHGREISSATADSRRRHIVRGGSRETKKSVFRKGTVSKFSKGRSGFYPSFGMAEKIRTVRDYSLICELCG